MAARRKLTRRDVVIAGLIVAGGHLARSASTSYAATPPDALANLSNDCVGVNAPPGRRVGEITVGMHGVQLPIDTAVFEAGGDVGGRFAIAQEGSRFFLDVGVGSSLNFESTVPPVPLMYYFPKVRWTSGPLIGSTEFVIRPIYPKVDPVGDATQQAILLSSMSSLYTEVAKTTQNRTIKINSSWIGIGKLPASSTAQPKPSRSNCTYEGHSRWAMRHGRGWIFKQGSNIVVKDWAFRVGTHLVNSGAPELNEVDNLMIAYKGSNWVRNIIFKNCSFSSSNDELARVTHGSSSFGARNVRFTNCLFAEPLFDAGHPKGAPHNLGPAVSPNEANVVFDCCLFLGNAARSPLINSSLGATVRNCVIGYWRASFHYGGTMLVIGDNAGTASRQITARLEGCLYQAPIGTGSGWPPRRSAIALHGLTDPTRAYIYIPSGGDYRNYHIDVRTDSFGDDPVVLNDGIYLDLGSVAEVIKSVPPYELANEYDMMPTATEADRRAVLARVLDYVGVRQRDAGGNLIPGDLALNHYDYDIVHSFRTAGTVRTDLTPARLASLYGTEWDGVGGSLGHGMTDVPAEAL